MASENALVPGGKRTSAAMSGADLKRNLVLIAGAVLGITLLLAGNLGGAESNDAVQTSATVTDIDAYIAALERKIAGLCDSVEGVSHVSVAVSLESGYQRVYARDDESYILVGSGASQGAVYLTDKPPAIGGIGIVCVGGGDAGIRARLIGLLSAAYGIGANKIFIAEAQN